MATAIPAGSFGGSGSGYSNLMQRLGGPGTAAGVGATSVLDASDALFSDAFAQAAHAFCALTRESTNLATLNRCLAQLQQSNAIDLVASDPHNEEYISCARTLLEDRPDVPAEFLPRLVTTYRVMVCVVCNSSTPFQHNFTASVVVKSLTPPQRITRQTATVRARALARDALSKHPVRYVSNMRRPATLRLRFTQDLVDRLITTVGDLDQSIADGNRANGYALDATVSTVVRDK